MALVDTCWMQNNPSIVESHRFDLSMSLAEV